MKRQLFFTVLAALGAFALVVLAGVPLPYPAQAQASPSVAVSLSSDTVEEGSAITVTMSFSGLESDADTATKDYVFRADVKGSEDGDADGCEDQAGGYGLGVDRYLNLVDENPETRTGSISADCPAGQYTVRASISDANSSELAADSADFSVVEPPSTDAALSGLALSGVDMGTFDPATYSYDVNVGHDLAETTVTPTPNDEGATYVVRRDGVEDGDGTVPLAEGSNVISVEVTAEDGQTTKTYTVIVTRAASESDTQQQQEEEESGPEAAVELSPPTAPVGTSIGVTMSFANLDSDSDTSTTDYVFRADVRDSNGNVDQCEEQANGYGLGVDRYMYRVDEDPETRTGTISADCPVGAYTLRVSISTPENVELASGSADFTVFDPDAPKSTDAALSGLSLSDVDFGTFTSTTTAYTASVGNDVAETTVTPTTNDDGATCVVKLDGVANSNGTVSLTEGANVITIEVTAEDGETIKVYTVTVTRTPNSPATGLPTISGTAQVGQTLTADTSGIADADGLDNVAFSYQWLSSRDTEIKGATGSTYMLQAAHQGKVIKVRVTFTDDAGNLESLTSEATAVVSASTQIASEDEPSLRSHITVVVAEDTSDPDNPRTDFTVTWKDVDVCSTRYNAYFSNEMDVTRGGDTTHLGSAAADGSQITSSLSTVAGEGIDFTLELYCGTEDSGRRVSSVSIIHGGGPSSEESNRRLVPGAYSSEPPLTALIVSTGILTPTFHSHTPKYTVQNGVSAVDRLTVVATAKPDYRVVFIKDVIGGSYIFCSPWGFSCTEWYYQRGDGNQVYPLTDADADAPGFQVDLAAGEKLAMHVLRDYRGRTLHNEFYSLTVNRTPNTLATGAPTISGMAQVGETLTASTSEIADEDRLSSASFSYQWIRNSGTTDIAGATGATYTLVSADEGKTIKVQTTFTDDAGHQETLTSEGTAVVVPRPNSPATGLPTISGTAQVGQTLTADTSGIADADGLDNVAFSYQWLSSRDTEIKGATGSTYMLQATHQGKVIKVRVTFTDDANNEETLTSAATAAVTAQEADEPAVTSIIVGNDFILGHVDVTVNVTGADESDVHLRYRKGTDDWTTHSEAVADGESSVEFFLRYLTLARTYTVEASYDSTFATGVRTTTFTAPPPEIQSVDARYVKETTATIDIVVELSNGDDIHMRYRTGGSAWTTTSKAANPDPAYHSNYVPPLLTWFGIPITGLTSSTEYEVQVSWDSTFPEQDTVTETFTSRGMVVNVDSIEQTTAILTVKGIGLDGGGANIHLRFREGSGAWTETRGLIPVNRDSASFKLAELTPRTAYEVEASYDSDFPAASTVSTTFTTLPPSTDATLSGLTLSGVDIGAFDPATTGYAADVDNEVTETTVTATVNDDGATYAIRLDGVADADGVIPLAEGSNVITIEVTAEDGETARTYIVIVTKAAPPLSNDATLSGLTLSGVNFGAFDMAATNYAAEVGHDVTESTVTPTASDDGATYVVKLGGVVDADRTVSLAVGENVLTIEVTAEDGQSTKTYTVTVTRADAEQAPSNPPEAPDKPTGEVTGKGQVALDWNDVAGATYYQARFWSSTEWVELPTADFGIVFDGSRATVSGLPNYGYYYFSVRAGNAGGPSDWSDFLTLYNPG